ncbi:bacillithiol biosynthesis deacetylase BshB1 [Sandaracinomonas limnophila]|uniref:Bacillithiol biosynthesis deacetylase BshB1 n=1 Tax=Sandaracinomonas limnophila TaxID=1862386 RepID=A0A437PXI6_9BACT|nr:bacillithiol biosynthesis deacetylase BshB1 [Sandaracinomonas limnophila]RVU26962.1 bacillithiol biosynthesis deacetylase BshB1 [Sandaracinomonas limnophila]
MKLDVLVMAAHPDDAELACSGTILALIAQGKKVGIVDFTRGELGTRGTPEIRLAESAEATKILGIHARENLEIRDGFFQNDEATQLKLVQVIRKYQPDVVLANALEDRHPDHGKGAKLAIDACFLAGLRQIKTEVNGEEQVAWRPRNVYHYIQDRYLEPDFVFDITPFWDTKEASIRAFKSQFFDPNSKEPASYISSPEFLNFIKARAMEMGHKIGVVYGEGFQTQKTLQVFEF